MSTTPSKVLNEAQARVGEAIEKAPFYQKGLLEIAALLPQSDDELHLWLEEAVAERDAPQFVFIICAAAMAGRKLQASLLPGGTQLMPDEHRFAWIAWHMEGDVTSNLLAALERQGICPGIEAKALFVAAAWWKKHREGDIPRPILAAARALQRRAKEFDKHTRGTLAALQVLTEDKALLALTPMARYPHLREPAIKLKDAMLGLMDGPFDVLIPEERQREFKAGQPMRRSVEHIGRNDRCRCGSGQKYKNCCEEADRDRLRLSTTVAGKTWREVQAEPDADLTLPLLRSFPAVTLARINPTKVPPEMREEYLMRLAAFGLFEELAAAFEKLGVTEELESAWKRLFLFVIRAWRREAAQRLVKAHPRGDAMLPETEAGLRLLVASVDAASFLEALEKEALAILESNDREETQSLALALLASPYKALGIFFTRGLLPLDGVEVSFLFDEILRARDQLCISPEDELADFVEEHAAGRQEENESPALREARAEHDRKAEEVRRVREELANARRQILLNEKRERRVASAALAAEHGPQADGEEIERLRAREKELKALLTERRQERLAQRKEIETLRQEVATLRAGETSGVTDGTAREADDEPGEPVETGNQPVRLLAFPKKFHEKLASFPRKVGRATMLVLGRIAAGESGVDVVKVLECEDVMRARVAGDYRVLFRYTSSVVEVLDVADRRDLQKRAKTLRAKGA